MSGYGQTGPYAPRAGFASVAEAMGGIRHLNGFPGEPPPRLHLSLGDSLAGMFAAQGILAALYRRDALGGGHGQVVDVSLLESCFALLESTVPEYDRLGIVRVPGGTGLKGVAPSNIFRSRDDKWMVIAANADNVFRRLCAAMGSPELADDERFSTHLARGEHQEEIEGIIAEWAGELDATEIDRVLNEAGVICGPIYTIADIFEDEHFRARDMLVEHEDPEFGTYIILHEMAHFIGHSDGREIKDFGKGWFTDIFITPLSADQRFTNADSYATFALECRSESPAKPAFVQTAPGGPGGAR